MTGSTAGIKPNGLQEFGNGFCDFWKTVGKGAQNFAQSVAKIKDDTDALYATLRLAGFIFLGIELAAQNKVSLAKPTEMTNISIGVIDFFQIFADVDYFVNTKWEDGGWYCKKTVLENGEVKHYKKDKKYFVNGILGKIALTIADIGGGIQWLAQMGLFTLAKAAEALGKIPVLSTLANIGLGPILTGVVGVGFIFYAADAIHRLCVAENKEQRIKAVIDLAKNVAEVALRVLLLVGVIATGGLIGLVILGVVATALTIVSFLYKEGCKEKFEPPALDENPVEPKKGEAIENALEEQMKEVEKPEIKPIVIPLEPYKVPGNPWGLDSQPILVTA